MTPLFGGGEKEKEKQKKEKKRAPMGWDAEDSEERLEAEGLKRTEMDVGRVELVDTDKSTPVIETYDEDTGELEGSIALKNGNREGLLALVKIIEEVDVEQDHDVNIESIDFKGMLNVENPSKKDRIWDIDLVLKDIGATDLETEEIKIIELGTDDKNNVDSREFQLSGKPKNLLVVKEYINSLPDADSILNRRDIERDLERIEEEQLEEAEEGEEGYTSSQALDLESFAIPIQKENPVYFTIAIKNLFPTAVKNIELTKNIPDDFLDVNITDTSAGYADVGEGKIVWTIEEKIPSGTIILLKFTAAVFAESIDKIKTGTIDIKYEGTSSFAKGLSINKFDAYTRNRFYVDAIERDEEPEVWDCSLVFENTSEFILQLMNADVYSPENEDMKLVDVDPNDVPPLPSGARWYSRSWMYESADIPRFSKLLEFRVMPDFQTLVNGTLAISDVELYVASITGDVVFSRKEEIKEREVETINVPTYKETDVYASLRIENNGSAPLNELIITHRNFNAEYTPPTAEEIKILWDDSEIDVSSDAISVGSEELVISLENLKESTTGMFEPESVLEIQYPIHCIEPAKESVFESEIVYIANTLPVSQEIEFIPEVPVIEAIHIRRKFRVGKEVMPIGALGNYQIILSIENIGDMTLENLTLMDAVPDNFEYGEYSVEPEITDEVGKDTLKWEIDKLEPAERLEITYEITGKGEYHPSDAQLAL
ncbi:MAG: hypothetical protein BAJALOKI1v1_950004 [Promethearchaeota archaeon]|nr:MAG: hypothetical protein BAJALOKI1v1_950004 [Candidatus Lokiarchaeota archaeon]